MKPINIKLFIDRYEPLYYEPESCPDEYKLTHDGYNSSEIRRNRLKNYLDIEKLNGTDYRAEEEVMKLLDQHDFDVIALAWKSGKICWEDNKITTYNFDKCNNYVNGYGQEIKKSEFKEYCFDLKSKKNKINKCVIDEEWEEAYTAVKEHSPKNIGPVYNINSLFFLTGGKAPIYDSFAHKAARSILLRIPPAGVHMGTNPGKSEIKRVMVMYSEYMTLLNRIFPDQINKDGMFIPRDLDRALWVYGHSEIIDNELFE